MGIHVLTVGSLACAIKARCERVTALARGFDAVVEALDVTGDISGQHRPGQEAECEKY